MPRADGPFKVIKKINENAYKLDLPTDSGVSPTFIIADLKPYLGEEDELESRMTQMQEGEDDVDINTGDTSTPTHNQISGLMRTSLLWIQPRLFIGVGVRLVFGLQESTYLQQLSRLHMDSNLGLLLLHGKIIKSTSRRIQPHVDTLSESVTSLILYKDVFCQW
jgi:hypothetical protein